MEENEKYLGKIDSVRFGLGGYQDATIGLHLSFIFNGSGISTSISAWDKNMIKHNEYYKWTEEDRSCQYAEIMRKVSDLLNEAKVNDISKLKGIPVEVEIKDRLFKSFSSPLRAPPLRYSIPFGMLLKDLL